MTTAIPTVKQQLKDWASNRRGSPDDKPQREREQYARRDLKILGSVGRSQFATTPDARELRLKGPVPPFQAEEAPAGAIIVRQPARTSDGRPITHTFIGRIVESGTFEKLAKQKTYRGPKERPARPIDAFWDLRRGSVRQVIHLDADDGSPKGIIRAALSKRPGMLFSDGDRPILTVAQLVEAANAAGANLRDYRGRTLCDWTKLNGRLRELVIALWPLVAANVADKPEPCAFEHEQPPLADTLDLVATPTCNGHVGIGTLAP